MEDPATCSDLNAFRLQHVDLEMDVDMDSKRIQSQALLRVRRLTKGNSVLQLDVFHLSISRVQIQRLQAKLTSEDDAEDLKATWQVKPFTSFGEILEISLPLEIAQEDEFVIQVHYTTQPTSPGVCWLEKEQTAGKKLPYMYTQGQEVLNRSLFPCQDSPSVRITYTAAVAVPNPLVCVMSAKLCSVEPVAVVSTASTAVEESENLKLSTGSKTCYRFEMQQSIPVYLVAMAVGDLVSADVGPRSSIWTEPCMLEAAKSEFDGILETYISVGERLFGEYLWERYDVLVMPPSFPYGGMENPRLTFISPCNIAGDRSLSSIIAHEISHSWFGNLVTNATWSDFFLNEGFTMYAERRLTEEVHGRSLMCLDAKLGEALLREEISSLGEDSPLTRLRVPLEQGIDPGDCYNQTAYEKGYAFVCYLRSLVDSNETFDSFLKSYCAHFRFKSIPAEAMMTYFLEYFPQLANGSELKGPISFATWLHVPGYPQFTPELSDAQELMEPSESLAYYWAASDSPVQANVLYLSIEAQRWPLFQLLYFLDLCAERTFTHAEVVIALGDALALWNTRNTEVMFRWSQALIKNHVDVKLDFVGAFLQMQGKQKFQLPLYRSLTSSSSALVRTFASETYAKTQAQLHVMVRDRIEALLDAMPKV